MISILIFGVPEGPKVWDNKTGFNPIVRFFILVRRRINNISVRISNCNKKMSFILILGRFLKYFFFLNTTFRCRFI